MRFIIKQQYISVGNKFQITDENDRIYFYGHSEILQFIEKLDLLDLSFNQIYTLKKRYFRPFGRFDIMRGEQLLGMFRGKFHFPWTKRVKVSTEFGNYYIYNNLTSLKLYPADEKFKKTQKETVCQINKKIFKLGDTYIIDFDENVLPPQVAALAGLWYDFSTHKHK